MAFFAGVVQVLFTTGAQRAQRIFGGRATGSPLRVSRWMWMAFFAGMVQVFFGHRGAEGRVGRVDTDRRHRGS